MLIDKLTRVVGTRTRHLLALACLTVCGVSVAEAQDEENFFADQAAAVRAAVGQVEASLVRIELIGVSEAGGGELEADAPTVGTVVDPDGWIIASSLVVARPAATILVVLPDGRRLTAEPRGRDYSRELVLLKVQHDGPMQAISLQSPPTPQVGQYAIAVGRISDTGPPAVSVGILSARGRLWGRALQTDARVSPAFYGGPLLDIAGRVLGIIVAAVPEEGGAEEAAGWYDAGIAFAIPIEDIAARLPRLKAGEDIRQGQLGIVADSSDPYAEDPEIASVRPRSPADKAGLKPQDRIVAINGQPVARHDQIRQALGPIDAGQTVRLEVRRDDQTLQIDATLVDQIPPFEPQRMGITAAAEEDAPVTVTAVVADSPAASAGIQQGDQITRLGDTEVTSVDQLRRRVLNADPQKPLQLTLVRNGQQQTIDVQTAAVAGPLANWLPAEPAADDDAVDWKTSPLALPDVPNKAAYFAPAKPDEATPAGLLIVTAEPGGGEAEKLLEPWRELAKQYGVAIAVVTPASDERWSPPEADVVGRVAATLSNQLQLDRSAVAITGDGAGVASSMALVVALTQASLVSGAALPADFRPPAMRPTENDPASPLQILLPLAKDDELPAWAAALQRAGYPIVRSAGEQRQDVIGWTLTLSQI